MTGSLGTHLLPTSPGDGYDHPLSPTNHPAALFSQRTSSSSASVTSTKSPILPSETASYFDQATIRSSHARRSRTAVVRHRSGDTDRLYGSEHSTFTERNAAKDVHLAPKTGRIAPGELFNSGTASLTMPNEVDVKEIAPYLNGLSKEEIAVVTTRFDLMSPAEIESYLGRAKHTDENTHSIATEQDSTLTPMPSHSRSTTDQDSPLFPPSPPPPLSQDEHPLRILSRAVHELLETVKSLEQENEALREQNRRTGSKNVKRREDEVSIHEGLTEALSTSLTSSHMPVTTFPGSETAASLRSHSSEARDIRAKSPTPSTYSGKSFATSLASQKSAQVDSSISNTKGNRSSWTGIWSWNGNKKSRPRKDSAGALSVQSRTVVSVSELKEDDSWRKGEGSPLSFRAIFLATVSSLRLS